MTCAEAMERLHIPGAADVFAENWDHIQSLRPDGEIPFLQRDVVGEACRLIHLPDDMARAAIDAAGRIAEHDAACALAWWCHHRLFVADGPPPRIRDWPLLTDALGRDAGMFNVLLLLAGTPRVKEIHRERGISERVSRDSLSDLEVCLPTEDYTRTFGHWGISLRILDWLMLTWRGELYRLGRLQFVPASFGGKLRVFRHRGDGAVVALSEEGVTYRADGQVNGAGGVADEAGAWTSALTLSDDEAIGHPISPLGHAVRSPLRLSMAEWEQVLAPGDPTLDMHIPAGPPMAFDLCGESICEALDFFPKHFPEKPFVALTSFSWLLDAQFEVLLPPTSNLVRFQKEVYLFPILSSGATTLKTVFGRVTSNPAELPRETTMQRALAEHLERGGHFRGAGCFLLPDDLSWGGQVYRRLACLPSDC